MKELMKKYMPILMASLSALLILNTAAAQPKLHSHNDYRQQVPFYQAYSQGIDCIECDMFHVGGDRFLVGHDMKDLDPEMTFDKVYLEPVCSIFRINGGHAWLNMPDRKLYLMVEIKSKDPVAYLNALKKKLAKHKDVFDPKVNPTACGLLITGFRLPYDNLTDYPVYFQFDVQYSECDGSGLSEAQLERIGSFSTNFRNLSKWKGHGQLPDADKAKLKAVIDHVHAMGKMVRFWGTPDTQEAWETFTQLGVDFVNTDHVEACAAYFRQR